MEDATEGHVLDGALEEYSLHELAEARVAAVAEHLLGCAHCRARLDAIEPVNFVHFTDGGPVYSRATRLTTGKVMARHWGKDLACNQLCQNTAFAKRFLTVSFWKMFPEHKCESRCGPTQKPAETVPGRVV